MAEGEGGPRPNSKGFNPDGTLRRREDALPSPWTKLKKTIVGGYNKFDTRLSNTIVGRFLGWNEPMDPMEKTVHEHQVTTIPRPTPPGPKSAA